MPHSNATVPGASTPRAGTDARRRLAVVLVTSTAIVLALFAGPVLMTPTYDAVHVSLGAATLPVVEVMFALLIDLPFAVVVTMLIHLVTPRPDARSAVRAGLGAVSAFFATILVCIAAAGTSPLLADLALSDSIPAAVSAARSGYGTGGLALMMALFLVFDLTLCAWGSLVGWRAVAVIGPRARG